MDAKQRISWLPGGIEITGDFTLSSVVEAVFIRFLCPKETTAVRQNVRTRFHIDTTGKLIILNNTFSVPRIRYGAERVSPYEN
ncbi:MAG: hypothetical protein JSS50_02385 [Proteobacteria bacterium]|nr:hypothetical protein [Pseudomonadota bacterium]